MMPLQKIMENCIPQKVIKGRYNLPWLGHSLRKKIRRKKNKYHCRAKRVKPQKRLQRWHAYRQLQVTVRSKIHTAHDCYKLCSRMIPVSHRHFGNP